jgi:hypothetical protein
MIAVLKSDITAEAIDAPEPAAAAVAHGPDPPHGPERTTRLRSVDEFIAQYGRARGLR